MASDEPIRPGHVPADAFPTFIATTPDFAIFAMDKNGVISSWNPGAERIKGWKAHEITGKHFSVFYTPSDVASRRPQYVLQRAVHEGRFEDEGWRVRKDGSMFWASVVITPLRASDGSVRGFIKVTRDLTARKHAEEAIRQSEERHRVLIESVRDYAIFILDPTGHVMSWNEGAERMKGYEPDEIIGRHFSAFYTQADRDRHHPEEEIQIALREGRYAEEGWRLRKDGTRIWAHVTITALYDSEKRHIGFAKVTRDLTERKKAEEALQARADSFAQLNRELDAFSHSVAHDLRAPTRAIHHLSEELLDQARERLSKEDAKLVRAIHDSAERMASIIQDLLDLSMTSRKEPATTPIDLSALARRVAEEKREQYFDREIRFEIQEGLQALADEGLLHLALSNLFDNAIKFTPGKSALVAFGREPNETGAAYYVRDEGVGFDAKSAGRVFEPFRRFHGASDVPGTGVGLTIVQRIIERHGGSVWAQSEPGKGATFRFTLDGRDLPPANEA